jgi:hypothetical protein
MFYGLHVKVLKRANDKNPTELSSRNFIFLPLHPPLKSVGWGTGEGFFRVRALLRRLEGHRPSCALDCALPGCSRVSHTYGALATGVGDRPKALRRGPEITGRW